MRDRLLQAKGSREVAAGEKKVHAEFKVAGKEIEKPRRNKKAANTNIAASILQLEKNGLELENKEEKIAEVKMDVTPVHDGESPTKRSRRSDPQATHLTGAHGEPCQDQWIL